MRVFISGIIQGSRQELDDLHAQDYRQRIAQAVCARHPQAEIIDPWVLHPDAASYTSEQAKQTLLHEIDLAGTCEVLIAYLPEASMGSALEMWSAYQAGAAIFSITNLTTNWVVLSLSTQTFSTLGEFLDFVVEGGLEQALDARESAR